MQDQPDVNYAFPVFNIARDPEDPNGRHCTNQTISQLTEYGRKRIRLMERQYFYYKYYYKYIELAHSEFNLIALRLADTLKIYRDAINANRNNLINPKLSENIKRESSNAVTQLTKEWTFLYDVDHQMRLDLGNFYRQDLPTLDILFTKSQIGAVYQLVELVYLTDEMNTNNDVKISEFTQPVTSTVVEFNKGAAQRKTVVIPLLMKLAKFFDYSIKYIPEAELM